MLPLASQWPGTNVFPLGPYFAVRTRGDRDALLAQARAVATSLDPEAGLFNAATLDSINRISEPRLYAVLLGTFAGLRRGRVAALPAGDAHPARRGPALRVALGESTSPSEAAPQTLEAPPR